MRVIAGKSPGHYWAGMASAVLRLVALFALVLMPLSLASAPASAQPAAAAAAGHCDERQKPAEVPADPKMHCASCTALPAMNAPASIAELRPQAPMLLALVGPIDGVEPETATPPPRLF
jgi:hypothetical protein